MRRPGPTPVKMVAMVEKIISGGQSGADRAGRRAAKAYGITTGGAMPKGFLTEDGPRPDYAELYGAVELPPASYPERTRRNVADAMRRCGSGIGCRRGQTTFDACRCRASRS